MRRPSSRHVLRLLAALLLAVGAAALAAACGGGGEEAADEPADEHADHEMAAEQADVEGLKAAENGVRLVLDRSSFDLGEQRLSFRILGKGGKPVTEFEVEQARELHLIVVRRDLTEFQHLHPALAPNGTWSVDTAFAKPGTYRVLADFVPHGGEQTVLGTDVEVGGGEFAPVPLPEPVTAVRAGDYDVDVDTGRLEAEGKGELRLEVSRNGSPVTDLEQYLGALGHAVILREGDLGYLHAHPLTKTTADSGGALEFHVTLPTAGRYAAFVQFRHENRVHLASFTVVSAAAS